MTVILSQQFFLGEDVPVGLLTAVLTRALALHSRQGREPLRGNNNNMRHLMRRGRFLREASVGYFLRTGVVVRPGVRAEAFPLLRPPLRPLVRTTHPKSGWSWPAFPCNSAFAGASLHPLGLILAVGAEALPVTPSGGALFAS